MSDVGDRFGFRGQYFREKHGAVVPRRSLSLARAGFSRVCIYDPPQLAISSGGSRRGTALMVGQSNGAGGGRVRFCRFVTLQCINEQTFIKAETVFSAIANCRTGLCARAPRRSTSSIFRPLFPVASGGGTFFFSEGRTPLNHSLLQMSSSASTAGLFQYFITVKKLFLIIYGYIWIHMDIYVEHQRRKYALFSLSLRLNLQFKSTVYKLHLYILCYNVILYHLLKIFYILSKLKFTSSLYFFLIS